MDTSCEIRLNGNMRLPRLETAVDRRRKYMDEGNIQPGRLKNDDFVFIHKSASS